MIDGTIIEALSKFGFPTVIATVLVIYLVKNVTNGLKSIADSFEKHQSEIEKELTRLAASQEAANYLLRVLVWRHGMGPNPADDIPTELQTPTPPGTVREKEQGNTP